MTRVVGNMVQESARRDTPPILLVGLGLLVCLLARGEGPASRAVLELGLVLVRLVRLIVGFVWLVYLLVACPL
jgi:hypothetical protein